MIPVQVIEILVPPIAGVTIFGSVIAVTKWAEKVGVLRFRWHQCEERSLEGVRCEYEYGMHGQDHSFREEMKV